MYLNKNLKNLILLVSLIIIIFFSIAYLLNQDDTSIEDFDISDRGLVIEPSVVENELESPSTSNERQAIVIESLIDNTIITGMEFFENDTLQQAQSKANSALFHAKYSDPREFIKLNWHGLGGMDYETVRKTITKDKLPLLYEMLNDKNYVDSWNRIAHIIGYISKDPNSIPILLDYFQRDDSWSWESVNLNNNGNRGFNQTTAIKRERISGKISALGWIGLIGGNQANNILREAVTEKGAEKLSATWIKEGLIPDSSTFKSKSKTITYIRKRAILGLMFSQDSENIEMIRKLYEIEEAKCREKRENNALETPSSFHNCLVETMGKLDYISENGLEGYLELISDSNYLITILPYIMKHCPLHEEQYNQILKN